MINFDRLNKLVDFAMKVKDASPEILADFKKLVDDFQRLASDEPLPTTIEELRAVMKEGDERVQGFRDFIVSHNAKILSHAIATEMLEAGQPSLNGVLSRLS